MKFTHFLSIAAFCSLAFAAPASAEVFQWRDPITKLTVTFPDTWRQVGNQQPDDIVTFAAPGMSDFASCRLRVREDRRFVIYPREYAANIQHLNYSRDFWENYIGEFDGAVINHMADDGGLGNGFASRADVNFISPISHVQKRGLMFATVYNDRAYIFECSAANETYAKWHNSFLSVLKSVDMRPEYTMEVNSHYRMFQKDPVLRIHGRKELDEFHY